RELVDRLIRERAERVELRGDQIVADLQRLARWSLVPVAVLDKHGRETGVERPLDGTLAARCLELLGKTLALFVDRKQTDFSGEVELTWSPVVAVEADAEPMDWPSDKPAVEALPAVEVAALESGDDPEQSEQDLEPAERPRFGGAVL
ncbi:MAG: hypothetical protein PHQ53_04550, partial [Candidatus Krumholzibacteria bacterium]|nr:hypothetical protein [Candidatus Krumholzibacteria bacterium]